MHSKEKAPKLNYAEALVLKFLAERWHGYEGGFYSFDPIAKETKLYRVTVRRACRSLTRKGLAEFSAGLTNTDGDFAGAGYSATKRGHSIWSARAVTGAAHDDIRSDDSDG